MSDTHVRQETLEWTPERDMYEYVTRLTLRFIQSLFSFNPPHEFRWNLDPSISEVFITAGTIEREFVEKTPTMTVIAGPMQGANLTIGNVLKESLSTEETTYTDLFAGSMAVYCVAGNEAIASRMAHRLQLGLLAERSIAERPGGFHQFARPTVYVQTPSPPGALVSGNPDGLVMVQVSIPIQYQYTWKVTPKSRSHFREIDMFMKPENGRHYPYEDLEKLNRVEVHISGKPNYMRRIGGRFRFNPSTEPAGDAIPTLIRTVIK